MKNLEHFKRLLMANKPLFQVDAVLVASDVALQPSAGEIYTIILRDVKDLMERLKCFPRWMASTCLECKPIKDESADMKFITFSFFEDIMSIRVCRDTFSTSMLWDN